MMANKTSKRVISIIAVYCIVLILYILSFTTIPFPKSATSWISFAFTVLSIVTSLIVCNYAFYGKNLLGAIYGFPIFRIGLIYMILQIIVGIVFCAIASFINVPYWIPLLVSTLLLGIAVILVLATVNARDVVEDNEETTIQKIKMLSTFNLDIAGIVDVCENDGLKVMLQELENTFKYSSDPVSNDATHAIEEDINNELKLLKQFVLDNDEENASQKIKVVSRLLAERNRICQANK